MDDSPQMFTVEETEQFAVKSRNIVIGLLTWLAGICAAVIMIAWTVNTANNLP